MRDYYINIIEDKVLISQNPNPKLITYEDLNDLNKRYLYKEGDKIVNPWGKVETIKEIIRDFDSKRHGYEWLIMVEENGNQYMPFELNGIFVKEFQLNEFNDLIK